MQNPTKNPLTSIEARATPALPKPSTVPSVRRITTLEDLREHLQWAIELEHFTLPPYLCALYSLDPARNPEATEVIGSVLVEEMLHMTLAANLLNAVGGTPQIDTPTMLPGYPACLPHSDRSFEVPLLPFCRGALDVFLQIERPALASAQPESDRYETISQFYRAIERGVLDLCAHFGEARVFCGNSARQVTGALFGPGYGRLIEVDGAAAALAAIAEIVQQGEGADPLQVWDGECDPFHPERAQVAHYYRFEELTLGRRYRRGDTPESGPTGDPIAIDWEGVRNMRANPRTVQHPPGSPIRVAQEQFNLTYCTLLRVLDQTFNGRPQLLMRALSTMFDLKSQAQALMQLPTGDGLTTAGPTFEYVAPEQRGLRGQR